MVTETLRFQFVSYLYESIKKTMKPCRLRQIAGLSSLGTSDGIAGNGEPKAVKANSTFNIQHYSKFVHELTPNAVSAAIRA